jgi:hypothetical protein
MRAGLHEMRARLPEDKAGLREVHASLTKVKGGVRSRKPRVSFLQDDTIIGLSTPLGVVERGFVVVGNLPSTDDSARTRRPRVRGTSRLRAPVRHGAVRRRSHGRRARRHAFGVALEQKPWDPDDFRFAAVDDNVPTLDVWTLR